MNTEVIEVYERASAQADNADLKLNLSYEERSRGRQRTKAQSGEEVHLFLDRTKPLEVGEQLKSRCGKTLVIEGAVEPVVTAITDDWQLFSRACYHLGNRHVKMQIGERWLRITPDHVLEDMLCLLGLEISHGQHVFVPENGAYSHGGHHH